MNQNPKFYCNCARIFAALLAGIFLIPAAHGQMSGERPVENRFLLIFDTSAAMKGRAPAVQQVLDNLFLTSFIGQLQPGDSIGVWTFDKNLDTGQLPLVRWMPEESAAIAVGIKSFIETQHYANTTRFGCLQPWLDEVVTNSERLTVLIFFDGETAVSGTPYDDKINQILPQHLAGQKKARQPLVIVLRVQLGKYVGCTLDFPPTPLSFPDFPPLPPPPAPPKPATPARRPPPAPPKRVAMPSIIMINTNPEPSLPPVVAPSPIKSSTNAEVKPPPAPKSEMNNPPSPAAPTNPVPETNAVSAPEEISAMPTNAIAETNLAVESNAVFIPPKKLAAQTNAAALPPEKSGLGGGGALAIGGALLAAAGGLTAFMLRRRKSGQASLITHSMRKK